MRPYNIVQQTFCKCFSLYFLLSEIFYMKSLYPLPKNVHTKKTSFTFQIPIFSFTSKYFYNFSKNLFFNFDHFGNCIFGTSQEHF